MTGMATSATKTNQLPEEAVSGYKGRKPLGWPKRHRLTSLVAILIQTSEGRRASYPYNDTLFSIA